MNAATPMANKPNQKFRHYRGQIRRSFLGNGIANSDPKTELRVVLYSHDTMGIGHMRRNLLIANKIVSSISNASVLVISGAKEASNFATMSGVDCLTLPAFEKRTNGTYGSRKLGITASDVLDLRTEAILAAVKSYKPDLLIVDKVPCGAGGELLPSLEWLTRHSGCQCVLGLREILDTAETVIVEWQKMHAFEIIRRHFDSIWIYGDRHVYDAVQEYKFAGDIAQRVTFTGYLDTRLRLDHMDDEARSITQPYVLCTVGGGQDGEALAMQFIDAMDRSPLSGVLLTGPYMPESSQALVRANAEKNRSLKVIDFVPEGDLLVKNASHVVSMGGYNTLTAILSHKKNALIVPRVTPRKEQLIRALRLAELGYVETIHPQELSPESINQWLNRSALAVLPDRAIDMHGLDRIRELIIANCLSKPFNRKRREPNADTQLIR